MLVTTSEEGRPQVHYIVSCFCVHPQVNCIDHCSCVCLQVHYIDFGNSEDLPVGRLRADVALPDIPQQCYECFLDTVKPVGIQDGTRTDHNA